MLSQDVTVKNMSKFEIFSLGENGKVILRGQMSKLQAIECCDVACSKYGKKFGYRLAHKAHDDRIGKMDEDAIVAAYKKIEEKKKNDELVEEKKKNDALVLSVVQEKNPGFWSKLWSKFVSICLVRLF